MAIQKSCGFCPPEVSDSGGAEENNSGSSIGGIKEEEKKKEEKEEDKEPVDTTQSKATDDTETTYTEHVTENYGGYGKTEDYVPNENEYGWSGGSGGGSEENPMKKDEIDRLPILPVRMMPVTNMPTKPKTRDTPPPVQKKATPNVVNTQKVTNNKQITKVVIPQNAWEKVLPKIDYVPMRKIPIRDLPMFDVNPNRNVPNKGRTFAIDIPFNKTGGFSKYRSFPNEEFKLGHYIRNVDGRKFLKYGDGAINLNSQFYLSNEDLFATDRDLVNYLLGNFIFGRGPENIVFPENGKFATMLRNSLAVATTLNRWIETGMRDKVLGWQMGLPEQEEIARRVGVTSLENFLGSVNVRIHTLPNGSIMVELFNITSLTSGDLIKDLTPDFIVHPLPSTTRQRNSGTQTQYSNISQYFSFIITMLEALEIIDRFRSPEYDE